MVLLQFIKHEHTTIPLCKLSKNKMVSSLNPNTNSEWRV